MSKKFTPLENDFFENSNDLVSLEQGAETTGFSGLNNLQTQKENKANTKTKPPFSGWFNNFYKALNLAFSKKNIEIKEVITNTVVVNSEITIFANPEKITTLLKILKKELLFDFSLGVTAVHYPKNNSISVVYELMSLVNEKRIIRIEAIIKDCKNPHISTSTKIYPTNNWHEREVYDLFGIIFDGFDSLARIMLPDDFNGHPLRKDYATSQIPVEFKGE